VLIKSDLFSVGRNAKGGGLVTAPRLSACKFPVRLAALCMLPVGCLCLEFKIHAIVISVFFFFAVSVSCYLTRQGRKLFLQAKSDDRFVILYIPCLFVFCYDVPAILRLGDARFRRKP
jgi:hypothetical protein